MPKAQSVITTLAVALTAIFTAAAYAQFRPLEEQIDSLNTALARSDDTTRALIYLELGKRHFIRYPEKAFQLTNEAKRISRTLDYNNGLSIYYTLLGQHAIVLSHDLEKGKSYIDSAGALSISSFASRELYNLKGLYFYHRGQIEECNLWLIKALRENGSLRDLVTADIYSNLATNYNLIGKYEEAIKYFWQANSIGFEIGHRGKYSGTLQNIATIYFQQKKFTDALETLNDIYRFELSFGNPKDNVTLLTSLGSVYHAINRQDSAYYFLLQAKSAAGRVNLSEAYSIIFNELAAYHLNRDVDSSRHYATKALMLGLNKRPDIEERAYFTLSKAHGKLGKPDSAYYFLTRYLVLHDSLTSVEKSKKIEEYKWQFEIEKKEQEIQNLELTAEAGRQRSVILGLALIVLMTSGIIVYLILRSQIVTKKEEIRNKNEQLKNFVERLVEKSEMVEELKSQIEILSVKSDRHPDQLEKLSRMLNSSILTEDDWIKFKAVFEQVHRGFFAELRSKHPDLSTAEIRLAALLRLNLSTREIANMLGISADSVGKTRKRLRKRLNLSPEQDLDTFIMKV